MPDYAKNYYEYLMESNGEDFFNEFREDTDPTFDVENYY